MAVDWKMNELRLAILQVLLAAWKRKPETGGASGEMLMDVLQLDSFTDLESALWYLREKDYIEVGERVFIITPKGLSYLKDELSFNQES